MTDSIITRVERILSNSANTDVVDVDYISPEINFKQFISEIEQVINEISVELEQASSNNDLATQAHHFEELMRQLQAKKGELIEALKTFQSERDDNSICEDEQPSSFSNLASMGGINTAKLQELEAQHRKQRVKARLNAIKAYDEKFRKK